MDRFFTALFELHPLHSMTVHFPIALTAVALLFLVLALWRRSEVLEQAAFFNISLAAVSTPVAGLTGLRDNMVRFEGAAPNANVKIYLGISLLILTTIIALSRRRRPSHSRRPLHSPHRHHHRHRSRSRQQWPRARLAWRSSRLARSRRPSTP